MRTLRPIFFSLLMAEMAVYVCRACAERRVFVATEGKADCFEHWLVSWLTDWDWSKSYVIGPATDSLSDWLPCLYLGRLPHYLIATLSNWQTFFWLIDLLTGRLTHCDWSLLFPFACTPGIKLWTTCKQPRSSHPNETDLKIGGWINLKFRDIITQFVPNYFYQGHALSSHVISSHQVTSHRDCHFLCLERKGCLSYNYQYLPPPSTQLCELNAATGKMCPRNMIQKTGFKYYEDYVSWDCSC